MQVLIVDDSVGARVQLRRLVEQLGHQVCAEAANGFEAIIQFEQHRPDVVFMDVVMPEMNGLDALDAIKKRDAKASVIVLTSAPTQANRDRALKAGAIAFLDKPATSAALIPIFLSLPQKGTQYGGTGTKA